MKFPIIRYFIPLFLLVGIMLLIAAKYRGHTFEKPPFELLPDMDHQAKIKYQVESDFFADGLGSRKPVEGTVPMGFTIPDEAGGADKAQLPTYSSAGSYYSSGKIGKNWGTGIPNEIDVSLEFLQRGQERYEIYCCVCHGDAGDGRGITSQYGIANSRNFHLPMMETKADGDLFNTIGNGYGTMGGYGHSIGVEDRWAIVTYLRILQKQAKDEGLSDELSKATISAYEWTPKKVVIKEEVTEENTNDTEEDSK